MSLQLDTGYTQTNYKGYNMIDKGNGTLIHPPIYKIYLSFEKNFHQEE